MRQTARICALLLCLLLLAPAALAAVITVDAGDYPVQEDGWYDSLEEVAVYLDTYGELPDNYLTKREAQALGWESRLGNLWDVADGCSLGGDRFGNYGGLLPEDRRWTECDIDYDGGFRGAKRLVFSGDGLIYYTADHYNTFDEVQVVQEEPKAEDELLGGVLDVLAWRLGE